MRHSDGPQPDKMPIACPRCGSRSVRVLSERDNFTTVSLKCGSCHAESVISVPPAHKK